MKTINCMAMILAAGFSTGMASAATATFDDLALTPDSYFRTGASTTFTSGGAVFHYDAPFGDCCWSGFTYSNKADVTTPGYLNEGSAITGDGVGSGQDNYAVGYSDGARLEFASLQTVSGAYFTNTAYAFFAMRDGDDGNATPFVKGPFGPGDFFTLTVTGLGATDDPVGTVDVALADGANILDHWLFADLRSLGAVKALEFSFASSDAASWGVNTPSYFAMDNLTTVPLPASVWLFASGFGLLGMNRRHSRRK